MILVALGSNLPGPAGDPRQTLEAALAAMPSRGLRVVAVSPWYRSAPVPPSGQPWFVNGVAQVVSDDPTPARILARLHAIEAAFGRTRSGTRNEARPLDLDLLDVHGIVRRPPEPPPELPHPRMSERAFVLQPLCDLVPDWRHPVLGLSASALLETLRPLDGLERIAQRSGA